MERAAEEAKMTYEQQEWARVKGELNNSLTELGFPAELGDEIAKNLGSPKAMWRMISYLDKVKPESVELVVDEMLAIRTEIEAWRSKKASEEANARYNEMLSRK
jgi:hypothetical protein